MPNKKLLYLFASIITIILIYTAFLSINLLNQNSSLLSHNQVNSYYPKVMGSSIDTSNNQIANLNEDQKIKLEELNFHNSYQIPVLMYHYIRDYNNEKDQIGTNLSVSPTTFDSQLKWLKDNGYQTVDFRYLEKPFEVNYKPLIITFDDGYQDAYTNALPVLTKYNFTATFYIITNNIGKYNYLTWDQITQLKNNGMDIGSHTLSHPDLSKATNSRVENEITQSKKVLEEKIGVVITDFCYPSGKYGDKVIEALKKNNYTTATTTISGIYDSNKNNLFEIPRLRMTNQTNLNKIL
ncbi:MAG: polysaccharide deacetylase [uncultured bacterium]|nr:MAG: polysaccharide deacetylase [uncultured bacterium]